MKNDYLQAMGIVSWRLRHADAASAPCDYYRYYLSISGSGSRQAVLSARAGKNPQQEQELLSAVIQALGLQAEAAPALSDMAGISHIIFLGAPADQFSALDVSLIATVSLEEMLNNPALKATAWQTLLSAEFMAPDLLER